MIPWMTRRDPEPALPWSFPSPLPPPPRGPLTLRDVLELQALVCSGPSEVEELAGPTHASTMGLLIGDSPLQGAGSIVQEVDPQLQVGLPGCQRGAEHCQLQPFAGCLTQGCLQNAGVEAVEEDGGGRPRISTRKAGIPRRLPPCFCPLRDL